jgi:hypothetical protein
MGFLESVTYETGLWVLSPRAMVDGDGSNSGKETSLPPKIKSLLSFPIFDFIFLSLSTRISAGPSHLALYHNILSKSRTRRVTFFFPFTYSPDITEERPKRSLQAPRYISFSWS